MKKFIALVLSLVMALSLCVPAFGAESKPVEVDNADDLVAALGEGNDVIMTDDITIDPASLSSGYGTTGVVIKNGQTFDGGGNTLIIKNANKTWDSGIATSGGVIKNLTVYGSFRGIFVLGNDKKAVLENVTVGGDGTVYTVHCDSGKGAGLEATNCTFNGWTSFAKTLGNATFTNCSFGAGSGYAFCRPYATATFVGCSFAEGYKLGAQADVYFDNCTLGGKTLTAADLATFVVENPENATVLSNAVVPEVDVKAEEPKVEANESLVGADKDAADVIAATGGVTIDKTELESVATDIAANTEVTEAEAVKALVDAGHSTAGATVVVESRFEVVVDDVDVANGTIALDITPVYQVVATNGTDKVVLEEGELDLENEAVEIKVQIPDALAAKGKLYVAHDGSELYEATVTGTTGAFFATFTTTSGFSPYVLYTDLQDLIAAAAANGDTVTLMGNVELPEQLTLPEGVTLDGNGYTISVAGDTWSTVNGYKNLVLLNKNTTLKNVTLDSEGKAYGVQAYCVTGVKLENVSIINSKGAGLTVNGATVDAVNLKASGNAWGSVNVDPGSGVTTVSKFTVSGNNTNLADATSIWSDGDNVTAGTNEVDVAISGGTYGGAIDVADGKGTVAISGGSFDTDVSAYVAPGSSFVNGKVVKTSSVGNTTTYDVKNLTVTAPNGSDVPTTGITKLVKVDSVTNTTTVNGKTTTTFVPAWYQIETAGGVETYVECDKSVATFQFTIKGVGSVYVRYMNVPTAFDATPVALYTAPKTATCDKVGANEDVYVLVDGKYYPTKNVVVESYGLLNGKMVVFDKTQAGTPTPHDWNNVTAASYNSATGKLTAVKCPVCKGTVAVYEKPGSFDGKEYKLVGGNGIASAYYYVVGAVATTPAGTAGATVESAETFDAGIAMYVAVSVIGAVGTVALGKKRED